MIRRTCFFQSLGAVAVLACGSNDDTGRGAPGPSTDASSAGAPGAGADSGAGGGAATGGASNAGGSAASGASSAGGAVTTGGATGVCGPAAMRLHEIFVGTDDYAVLENTGSCTVDVAGMMLSSDGGVETTLPSHPVAPGALVYVTEAPRAGDLTLPPVFWSTTNGGFALLCTGPCSSEANIIDAVAFHGAALLAVPAEYDPLAAIESRYEDHDAYLRVAYEGAYPNVLASDWIIGQATRGICPEQAPTDATACSALGHVCTYGATACSCTIADFVWHCQ